MSKEVKYYRQCRLRRPIPNGRQETTSYIPESFAEVGRTLKLKGVDEEWVDGWVVESIGPLEDAKYVEANARNYLKQRKASDVVFAKIKAENEKHHVFARTSG